MDPFADVDYYEENFGTPPDLAGALLARASRLVRAECPDVDQRIAEGDLDPDVVADVVCEMVQNATADVLGGGAGVESASRQIGSGPFQMTQTQKFASPVGAMVLNRKHRRLLGCGQQEAFVVSLAPAWEGDAE